MCRRRVVRHPARRREGRREVGTQAVGRTHGHYREGGAGRGGRAGAAARRPLTPSCRAPAGSCASAARPCTLRSCARSQRRGRSVGCRGSGRPAGSGWRGGWCARCTRPSISPASGGGGRAGDEEREGGGGGGSGAPGGGSGRRRGARLQDIEADVAVLVDVRVEARRHEGDLRRLVRVARRELERQLELHVLVHLRAQR